MGPKTLIPIIIITLFAIASITSTIMYLPTSTPYSIYNTGSNGFSESTKIMKPLYSVNEVSELPSNTTLFVFSNELVELDTLTNYVSKGGTLIILYDTNQTTSIIRELLEGICVENIVVIDNTYHLESGEYPYVWITMNKSTLRMVLHKPSPIKIESSEWIPIAHTSPFAFEDIDGDGIRDPFETRGKYVVGACRGLGRGKICVFTSPSLLSNNLLKHNIHFLNSLGNGLYLYIDPNNLPIVDRLKLFVQRGFSQTLYISLLATLSIILGAYFRDLRLTRVYYFVLVPSTAMLLVNVFTDHNWEPLILLGITYASVFLRRESFASTSLASVLLFLGLKPEFLLLSLPLYVVYPLTLGLTTSKPPSDVLGSSTSNGLKIVSGYMIASIMYPASIPSLTVFLLLMLSIALVWYAKLRGVVIKVPDTFEVTLGRRTSFPVLLENMDRIRVYGRIGSTTVVGEFGIGTNVLNIPYYSKRLGARVEKVEIIVEDVNGLASRRYIYNVTIRAVPLVSTLVREVSAWLGALVEYAGRFAEKKILEAGLLLERAQGIRGAGGEGVGGTSVSRGGRSEEGIRGAGRTGLGEEGVTGRAFRKAIVVFGEGWRERARRGVYYGVRFYVPGDDLRDIHWKKSISRRRLVVKEYTSDYMSGGGGRGSGAGSAFLIADLEASSPDELDRLAYDLVSYLVYGAMYMPETKIMVYLTLPNGDVVVLRGDYKTVLASIVYLFKKGLIRVDLDYYSQSAPLPIEDMRELVLEARGNTLLRLMLLANTLYVQDVVKTLREAGINPPSTYFTIYGLPTSFKHSYLDYILMGLGYRKLVRRRGAS